jgi:FkbM family methyltransferase
MSLISSAITTLSTRGGGAVIGAAYYLALGSLNQLFGRRFMRKRIYDYQMWLDLEDRGISRTLLLFGERELDHKIMLERVLKPGMTVLDIGANIGYYALMERRLVGDTGRLIMVEPSPSNVQLLRRNLALNNVAEATVIEAAVSNDSGSRAFNMSHMSNLNTFHPTSAGDIHLSGETIDVTTLTVPEIAAQHGAPDLIRMDVEGHEVEVLDGMIAAVQQGLLRPMVIFETHLSRYGAEHDMADVLRRLFALGYRVTLAASSWQNGTKLVEARGYSGATRVQTDDVERVIFTDISNDHALEFICSTGGLRTVLLAPDTV